MFTAWKKILSSVQSVYLNVHCIFVSNAKSRVTQLQYMTKCNRSGT